MTETKTDNLSQYKKIERKRVPTDIIYHRRSRVLELRYETHEPVTLGSEYLRVYSPSAEVQGHGPGEATLQVNKQDVNILGIEPQGSYAIRITFDDGHNTGVYTWNYLWELAEHVEQKWQDYLSRLSAAGYSR